MYLLLLPILLSAFCLFLFMVFPLPSHLTRSLILEKHVSVFRIRLRRPAPPSAGPHRGPAPSRTASRPCSPAGSAAVGEQVLCVPHKGLSFRVQRNVYIVYKCFLCLPRTGEKGLDSGLYQSPVARAQHKGRSASFLASRHPLHDLRQVSSVLCFTHIKGLLRSQVSCENVFQFKTERKA